MSLQIRIHFSCNSNKRLKNLTWKHCFLCFILTLRTLQKFCEVASIDDQLSKRNKCLNSDYLCDEKIKKRFTREKLTSSAAMRPAGLQKKIMIDCNSYRQRTEDIFIHVHLIAMVRARSKD